MRREPAPERRPLTDIFGDSAGMKIAVFRADIDVGRNGVAHAGNQLPGDAAVPERLASLAIVGLEFAPREAKAPKTSKTPAKAKKAAAG